MKFRPQSLTSNGTSQIPKFDFVSNVKPSLFAYPPPTKLPEKQQVEKVQTAVLSTTAKSTARAKEKEKEKNADSGMQTVRSDDLRSYISLLLTLIREL